MMRLQGHTLRWSAFLRGLGRQRCNSGLAHLPSVSTVPLFGSTLIYRKVRPEPGGGLVLPVSKYLYDAFKPKGGLYLFDTGAFVGLGQMVMSTDPKEFVKVLQNEGMHPEGLTNVFAAPAKKWFPELIPQIPGSELWARRDDVWAEQRASLKGLLAPQSARGHLGNINKSAQLASKGAGACGDDFSNFLNRSAFDAFSAVLFGTFMRTADPSVARDPRIMEFLHDTVWLTRISTGADGSFGKMMWAYYAGKWGMSTTMGRELKKRSSNVNDYSKELLDNFIEKMNKEELDESERSSYLMSALQRSEDSTTVPIDKLIELAQILLLTSVDTTSAILQSVVVQLTLEPGVQHKLAGFLREEIGDEGVSMDLLKNAPKGMEYLNAIVRECHRIRPPIGPVVHFKRAVCDLEMHGHTVPKDSLVAFDLYSIQNDPNFVPDPEQFRPERWLPEAVKGRKGTAAAVIDHALLKTPFSSGARQCPAARVASLEVQCIIAHLVKDWSFEFAHQTDTTKKTLADFENMQGMPGYTHPFPKLKVTSRNL